MDKKWDWDWEFSNCGHTHISAWKDILREKERERESSICPYPMNRVSHFNLALSSENKLKRNLAGVLDRTYFENKW